MAELESKQRRCIVCDRSEPFPTLFVDAGANRLVRCPECRLVFQDPQPSDAVLRDSYYHDPSFAEALFGTIREITVARAREKLPLVRPLGVLRPGARTLDVGCSSGAWLQVAIGEGLAATGVEVGEAVARRARQAGLDVRTGTLGQAMPTLEGENFDLITFWDVLEHLRDPREELRLAATLLAPGGLVAATFPNVEGLYPQLTLRLLYRLTGVWEYPELPVHLYDFAPRTARRLFERTGYEVTATKTMAVPFEVYRNSSLSKEVVGRGRQGPRGRRAAFEMLRIVAYPVASWTDRGNALFVAARRASG